VPALSGELAPRTCYWNPKGDAAVGRRSDGAFFVWDKTEGAAILDEESDAEGVIGIDHATGQAWLAERERLTIRFIPLSLDGGRLVRGNPLPVEIEEADKPFDLRVLDFVNSGKGVLVTSPEQSWYVTREGDVREIGLPAVERIASSPSGGNFAMLRQVSDSRHGGMNLLLSFATIGDQASYGDRPLTLFDTDDDPLFVVNRSEESPVRNRLLGHTGAWHRQGHSEIHFLAEDELVVVTGGECRWFSHWDRRAWDEPFPITEPDQTQDDDSASARGTSLEFGVLRMPDGRMLSQEYPVAESRWLASGKVIATAAYYKSYGAEIRIWDTESATTVFGPFPGTAIGGDSDTSTLRVSGAYGMFGGIGFPEYLREIHSPAKADRWLLDLARSLLESGAAPTLPANLSGYDRDIAERLLAPRQDDSLKTRCGSSATRGDYRTKTASVLRLSLGK
jgi:hypothetical protein